MDLPLRPQTDDNRHPKGRLRIDVLPAHRANAVGADADRQNPYLTWRTGPVANVTACARIHEEQTWT